MKKKELEIDTISLNQTKKKELEINFWKILTVLLLFTTISLVAIILIQLPLKETKFIILEYSTDKTILVKSTIIDDETDRKDIYEKAEIKRYISNREAFEITYNNYIKLLSTAKIYNSYIKLKNSRDQAIELRSFNIDSITKTQNSIWIANLTMDTKYFSEVNFLKQTFSITIWIEYPEKCEQSIEENEINPLCIKIKAYNIKET